MQVPIFTIAFAPRPESFADEELCAFLLTKQMSAIRSEFSSLAVSTAGRC